MADFRQTKSRFSTAYGAGFCTNVPDRFSIRTIEAWETPSWAAMARTVKPDARREATC